MGDGFLRLNSRDYAKMMGLHIHTAETQAREGTLPRGVQAIRKGARPTSPWLFMVDVAKLTDDQIGGTKWQ